MAALSQDRVGIVRALIETIPDGAIRNLDVALKGDRSGGALSAVKTIVHDEMCDRTVRDTVFAPVAPLCRRRSDGFDQLAFPMMALTALWRAAKKAWPGQTALAATEALRRRTEDEAPPAVYDDLCQRAAQALRDGAGEFAAVAATLDRAAVNGAADFAAFLDIAPIARQALERLPNWLSRMTEDRAAAARVMFKDAVAISDDSGPRLIEILFAHLPEPWAVLRLVSAVMLRPGDRYASSSELSMFGERLLDSLDRRIESLRAFDYDGGPEAGVRAAETLRVAASVAGEFDQCLAMERSGPWGERLSKQKQALAALAESHLRKIDKAVADALPMQPVRVGGRAVRNEPKLTDPPEPRAQARALALLTFFDKVRGLAASGGYGTTRAKVGEEVCQRVDSYVEELLSLMHAGEAADPANAKRYLEAVAGFTALLRDDRAAQVVRRRAAAA